MLPQPNADIRIAAFTNGAGHIALDRGAERKPIVGRLDIHFQQELSLRQADVVRTGCEDEDAAVRCEAVFATAVHNSADTSLKADAAERDLRNRHHNRARLRKAVALQPQIRAGKGRAVVHFDVSVAAVEAVWFTVNGHAAAERMRHTDDAVTAFHREESKRSHDVRAQRRERSVGDLSADTGKIDPASAPRELTASGVNDSAVYRQLRHVKLFGTVGGDHLNECAMFGLSGNERGHVLIVLVLEIPALEAIVFHGMPSGVIFWTGIHRIIRRKQL